MLSKNSLRKKFYSIRKKKYFDISKNFLQPINFILKKKKTRKVFLSIYYPMKFELNLINILKKNKLKNINLLLPKIYQNKQMKFHLWFPNDPLEVNSFGTLEPLKSKKIYVPDVMLLPLLAFDKNRNRLGYGKGYYDRYLSKTLKKKKQMIKIGIAFSFQKSKKIPFNSTDVKLDYILTEKGIL